MAISIKVLFIEKEFSEGLRSFHGKIVEELEGYYFKNEYLKIEIRKEDVIDNNLSLNIQNEFYLEDLILLV